MDQADRPPRQDRQPDGAHQAVQGLDQGQEARLARAPRRVAASPPVFSFVQWELPGRLGPGAGRYVVRPTPGEGPEQVLVLREVGGAPRRKRGRAASPEVAPVPVTVATVISATPVADGETWLAAADDEVVTRAFATLATAVHAHRVAAADPLLAEASPDAALVVRVGYGSGDEVADGRWTVAREVPGPRRAGLRERRRDALRPQERLAALLGGRDAVLACEELVLRGRLDLDRGRGREAALQAHLALEAARVELAAWSGLSGMAERIGELDGLRDGVAAAANAALAGGLGEADAETAATAIDRIEAALRARATSAQY